jgi:hypothetical protein
MMSDQPGVSATQRRLSLFFALAWLSAWWAFTLSLGWVIMGGSFTPLPLEPVTSLASRLF